MQMEVHVDHNLHRHGMSLIHGRLEPVLPHCFNGLFVQPHAEMTNQPHILRISLRIDDELDRNAALKIRSTSVFCELRLNGMDDLRCGHSTAHAHQASTVAAPAAWTCPNSAAEALTKSGTAPSSLRGQRDLWRLGHAEVR